MKNKKRIIEKIPMSNIYVNEKVDRMLLQVKNIKNIQNGICDGFDGEIYSNLVDILSYTTFFMDLIEKERDRKETELKYQEYTDYRNKNIGDDEDEEY